MAKKVSSGVAPTGHEVLMEAFEKSKDKTVDLVVEQEVAGITEEIFNWWMQTGILQYARRWWPRCTTGPKQLCRLAAVSHV